MHWTPSQPREDDVVTQTVNDLIAVARTHAITKVHIIESRDYNKIYSESNCCCFTLQVRQYMRCDTIYEGQLVALGMSSIIMVIKWVD